MTATRLSPCRNSAGFDFDAPYELWVATLAICILIAPARCHLRLPCLFTACGRTAGRRQVVLIGVAPAAPATAAMPRFPCRRALEVALASCTNALDTEAYELEKRAYPAIGAWASPCWHVGACHSLVWQLRYRRTWQRPATATHARSLLQHVATCTDRLAASASHALPAPPSIQTGWLPMSRKKCWRRCDKSSRSVGQRPCIADGLGAWQCARTWGTCCLVLPTANPASPSGIVMPSASCHANNAGDGAADGTRAARQVRAGGEWERGGGRGGRHLGAQGAGKWGEGGMVDSSCPAVQPHMCAAHEVYSAACLPSTPTLLLSIGGLGAVLQEILEDDADMADM